MFVGCLNHIPGTIVFCGERDGSGQGMWCSFECTKLGLRAEGMAVLVGVVAMGEWARERGTPAAQVWRAFRGPYR